MLPVVVDRRDVGAEAAGEVQPDRMQVTHTEPPSGGRPRRIGHNVLRNDRLGAKKYSPPRIVTKLAIRNASALGWPPTGHDCASRVAVVAEHGVRSHPGLHEVVAVGALLLDHELDQPRLIAHEQQAHPGRRRRQRRTGLQVGTLTERDAAPQDPEPALDLIGAANEHREIAARIGLADVRLERAHRALPVALEVEVVGVGTGLRRGRRHHRAAVAMTPDRKGPRVVGGDAEHQRERIAGGVERLDVLVELAEDEIAAEFVRPVRLRHEAQLQRRAGIPVGVAAGRDLGLDVLFHQPRLADAVLIAEVLDVDLVAAGAEIEVQGVAALDEAALA